MRALRRQWLLGALLVALASPVAAADPVVAVTTIIEHPALAATRRGLEAGLSEIGLVPGQTVRLIHRSAHGSRSEARRIAAEFASLQPDVIVPISTPSAQAVAAATEDVPVVFAAVTDPVAARLVDDLLTPGGNVVGVADHVPAGDQLDLIVEILPQIRRLGVIFSAEEVNAVSAVRALERAAALRRIEVISRTIGAAAELREAGAGLAAEIDAFFVPQDNTVVGALEALVEVALDHRLPVFGSDIHTVPRGAVAALGFNYFEVGRQAATLVQRVIAGERPATMPVQSVRGTDLYLNLDVARRLGLDLPEDVVKRARVALAAN